ncbi:TOBE domain-containing protein [Arcobacter sp. CECT 8985]|uniref:TOBE domain-containing protein n=1 Tax=Arcobacter sp. CECT 8985 TaxID=1935424 RepID=UPI00100A2965|nr:TOBE domain-containing protein [Arcobacter sp. CECT 8985]RXJ86542.1 molybdenum-binding protein [Arcobacter sp. CECT 8985]
MQFESTLTILNSDIPFLLEKRIKLLEAIEQEGSISKAAKLVPMSYKTAWEAVDSINNLCPKIVVKKETGGKGGGGAILTEYGKNLIQTYSTLQDEHKKFLEKLTNLTDFNTGSLKSLKRFSMQISARNQLAVKIIDIIEDNVNANIILQTKSKQKMISNISKNSVETLGLKKEDEIIAIFKSNNVMISITELLGLSARNKLEGIIKSLNFSEVSCEVVLEISTHETITSVITNEAAKQLDLKVGQKVFAVIKSSDIMIGN